MKSKKISVTLNPAQLELFDEALGVQYFTKNPYAEMTARERAHFVRLAVWAICAAIVKRGERFAPLACDLRRETAPEADRRVNAFHGKPAPAISPPFEGFAVSGDALIWRKNR